MFYLDQLKNYIPQNEPETVDRRLMLKHALEAPEAILTRESELMHMTASSMIVNAERTKVLMAYHNIYRSWAWTGGHADGENDMLMVAVREAMEETGISCVKPISSEPFSIEILHVNPHIKRGKFVSAHLHFNMTYALECSEEETLSIKADENSNVSWLEIDRLSEFVSEKSMLPIYEKIISRILHDQTFTMSTSEK
ncbi:MAG: NUDIX hydrolase [Clostridia bacterium]|nr:NUDIX hydrolase [Clostridia bacterium]MBQ4159016.1 NUDIX hydrolase [Clostridia bacterium]